MADWNRQIIEEFRANEGKVGGMFEGAPLLLLHHVGAKSGTHRVTPLMYQPVDVGYAVFASYAGHDRDPAWFHNLMANPETEVEIGTDKVKVKARHAVGEERDRIWRRQKQDRPQFAEYERKTARQEIPVIVLEIV